MMYHTVNQAINDKKNVIKIQNSMLTKCDMCLWGRVACQDLIKNGFIINTGAFSSDEVFVISFRF